VDEFLKIAELSPLTEKEEKILEAKMVWIFGSIRSGTTWLGRDLLRNPSNVYWHEPYIGWLLDVIPEWHSCNENSRYFFHRDHLKNILPSLRKLILARTYSQVQSLSANVIIKEPNGSGTADIIMRCFPKSKLIFLLRDGRDVIDSIIDSHKPNSWNQTNPITKFEPFTSEKMRLEAIEKHSKDYVRIIETVWEAYQEHDTKLRILVKYEDLLKDTFNEMKKIYKFLDISISDDNLKNIVETYDFSKIPDSEKGSGKFYRSATIGTWKKNLTVKEQEIIISIISSTLTKFGYL